MQVCLDLSGVRLAERRCRGALIEQSQHQQKQRRAGNDGTEMRMNEEYSQQE